jgi:hypothetical protein
MWDDGSLRTCENALRVVLEVRKNKPAEAITAKDLDAASGLLLTKSENRVIRDRIALKVGVA